MNKSNWSTQYLPAERANWSGRADSLLHERYFQIIKCLDMQQEKFTKATHPTFGIIGFCCDAGVKRNQGRPGAAEGPKALRKQLAKLAFHGNENFILYDLGDISCDDDNLEIAQAALSALITETLKNNITPIILGGGHEVAWGHWQGLANFEQKNHVSIINFDAHYDLRPLLENKLGSSGTPFRQIAEWCEANNERFDYTCIGIQKTANTKSLMSYAKQLKINTLLATNIHANFEQCKTQLLELIKPMKHIYLTICLDVFSSAFAPGVSAPSASGLLPWQVIELLKIITQSGKVISFDIAECAPRLDNHNQTAQLGAQIIATYLSK